jgi:hypothetical protein
MEVSEDGGKEREEKRGEKRGREGRKLMETRRVWLEEWER